MDDWIYTKDCLKPPKGVFRCCTCGKFGKRFSMVFHVCQKDLRLYQVKTKYIEHSQEFNIKQILHPKVYHRLHPVKNITFDGRTLMSYYCKQCNDYFKENKYTKKVN